MKVLQIAIEKFFNETKKDPFPSCFKSKKEYLQWTTLEADAPTEPRKFPCRDCTRSYQATMRSENRCYIPLVNVSKIAK